MKLNLMALCTSMLLTSAWIVCHGAVLVQDTCGRTMPLVCSHARGAACHEPASAPSRTPRRSSRFLTRSVVLSFRENTVRPVKWLVFCAPGGARTLRLLTTRAGPVHSVKVDVSTHWQEVHSGACHGVHVPFEQSASPLSL